MSIARTSAARPARRGGLRRAGLGALATLASALVVLGGGTSARAETTITDTGAEPAPVAVEVSAGSAAALATPAGSVFQALTPARLADTRQATCGCERVDATTIRVPVVGRAGVPAGTTAVALSVTVSGTTAAGYATVWPTGSAMPGTSTLNWGAGQTRANGTILAVGANGGIDVYVSSSAQVIVDVTGAFVPAPGPVTAGRYQSIPPARLLDSRAGGRIGSGSTVTVPLPAGVPSDATALAVTVTATDSAGWGYVVAYPAGTARPESSVVNTDGGGQTRAATAIVPVTAGGIDLYVDGAAHVLVDVYGWFSGASAPPDTAGLFVAQAPLRFWDTRPYRDPVWSGGTMEIYPTDQQTADLWAQLFDASALVFNLTVAETSWPGWMTAYPARTPQPNTSTINWGPDETVANLAISPWSTEGAAFYADKEADLIVDITGYFTGTPVPATLPEAPNDQPGYTGESPYDLVRDSVPGYVWDVLGGVQMATVPYLGGAAGVASYPPYRIEFAHVAYEYRRSVTRSTAAHEVGHILTYGWIVDGNPESRVDQIGGHECIAEAIGRLLFAELGRTYQPGYGGAFDACATAPETVQLAAGIVASQT